MMDQAANKQDNSSCPSSAHRLPTLSAADALQAFHSASKQSISTGLKSLDALLQGREPGEVAQDEKAGGGLRRGQVTEVWGPAGVGKTAFAIQVVANALNGDVPVVWIDCSYEIVGSRLRDFLSGSAPMDSANRSKSPSSQRALEDLLHDFHHFTTPTLSHLLVLLAHSSDCFPPEGAGLMIVDCISSLFATAFPKVNDIFDSKEAPEKRKADVAQWAAGRRWAVVADVISSLSKLAAMKNMAILLTSQAVTKITPETGAMLHPSLESSAWTNGISTRIVLFRDWAFKPSREPCKRVYLPGVRFARVLKAVGISPTSAGKAVPFLIKQHGLQSIDVELQSLAANVSDSVPTSLKRKSDRISGSPPNELEIGSDEEFGWADDDEPFNIQNFTKDLA